MTCAAYQGLKVQMVELRVSYDYARPLVLEHAADLAVAGQRARQLFETLRNQEGFERLP